MDDRSTFQAYLQSICPNVFYQPGKNVSLTYPCVVYKDSQVERTDANNHLYTAFMGYQVTVISRDADDPIPKQILKNWPNTGYQNAFITDNLYHTVLMCYTIY